MVYSAGHGALSPSPIARLDSYQSTFNIHTMFVNQLASLFLLHATWKKTLYSPRFMVQYIYSVGIVSISHNTHVYMSFSATHSTFNLFILWETVYAIISVKYIRTYYE